jgi:hypothetical protein
MNANAQVLIAWGSKTAMMGDVDLATNGTYFDAVNTYMDNGGVNDYVTTTVGTTTFNVLTADGYSGSETVGTDGTITVGEDGGSYAGDGFVGGSTNYNYVVNKGSDANAGFITIGSLAHPLTLGDTYQVEIWSVWTHGPYEGEAIGDPSVSFDYASTEYAIGTFTAGATTETFDYTGAGGAGANGFINDVVVREIPEPSSVVMLLAGLGFMGVCLRRGLVRQAIAAN